MVQLTGNIISVLFGPDLLNETVREFLDFFTPNSQPVKMRAGSRDGKAKGSRVIKHILQQDLVWPQFILN